MSTAQTLPIFRRHVVAGWRGQLGWTIGIVTVIGIYLPLYSSLQTPAFTELLDSLPPELSLSLGFDEIATGAGYAQATFFGLVGFALITLASVTWGAAFIAGAEESGQLELILAHAVGRTQYAVESIGAVIAKVVALGAVAFVLILVLNEPSKLALSPGNLFAGVLAWVSVALLCGTAALTVGSLFGRRAWATGAGAGVAVTGFALNAVRQSDPNLEWLGNVSPVTWAFGNLPLENGFDWGGLALLWGMIAICIAVAIWGLSRRDVLG